MAGDDHRSRQAVRRLLRDLTGTAVVDVGTLDDLQRAYSAPRDHRRRPWFGELAIQVGLIVGAALLYFAVRGVTEGSAADSIRHGQSVLGFEARLGIDVEHSVQRLVLDRPRLTTLANWVYIWGHWPLIAVTLVWLHRNARGSFNLLRNAMFVSGAIGLVIFATFPVAPPRHLSNGFVDTVTELSHSYRVLQPPQLINEYAAIPSLHVGWNLLVGVVLFRRGRRWFVKAVGLVSPALMAVAVVATANHYVIDGLIGSAVALIGLAVAQQVPRLTARVRWRTSARSRRPTRCGSHPPARTGRRSR